MAGSVSQLSALVLFVCVVGVLSDILYYQTASSFTLHPALQAKLETILWKLNNDKVVEFDGTTDDWYKFKDRARLNRATGEFTLQNLTPSDSGEYLSEIQVDKKLKYSTHQVVVMDPVPQPEVKCFLKDQDRVELRCSVDPPVSASFSWSGPEEFKSTNQSIDVSWVANAVYFCSVKNIVSESHKEFNLNDCSKGSPDRSSGAVVGAVVGLIAIIAVFGGCGFLWLKRPDLLERFRTCIPKPDTSDKQESHRNNPEGTSSEQPLKADENNY